ncbi:ribose 5-phosphate isomerase B [Patescibacteria group bacterium]|nr:MAG: ribose 5-phosphate isomerase B [Patescibacteria group bacterium]
MTIFLGSDHAGFKLKEIILEYLVKNGYQVKDLGNHNLSPNDDYPDYAAKAARAVQKNLKSDRGILICGSGQGVCMTANKFKGIRAALGYSIAAAKQSRAHGDSNVLCLPGLGLNQDQAKKIVNAWLKEKFSGEARHKRRLKKIAKIEKSN